MVSGTLTKAVCSTRVTPVTGDTTMPECPSRTRHRSRPTCPPCACRPVDRRVRSGATFWTRPRARISTCGATCSRWSIVDAKSQPKSARGLRVLRYLRLSRARGQPAEIALSQLVFCGADVVGGGGDRQGPLNGDDHDPADALACLDGAPRLVELDTTLEDVAVGVHRPGPLEAVALADKLVHDVDLDARVRPQVRDRPRRAQVGEHQVVVVPHRRRPLRREVRSSVGT